jgi:di/tricarboxylate transporter
VALWILVAIALASSSSGNALTIAIVASLGFMMPASTPFKKVATKLAGFYFNG